VPSAPVGHDGTEAWLQAIGRADIWQRAFFALHNYGANHPPAYPYDAQNQQDHPGATIFSDDTATLNFLQFAKWMQDRIGFVLPMIGGEGGWQFGAQEDSRYPATDQPYHAQYHSEMFNWFRTGVLSNGEALPDYLFSVAPWIASGTGKDDWWGGPLGDKTVTNPFQCGWPKAHSEPELQLLSEALVAKSVPAANDRHVAGS